jgi:hypothetical protein
MRTTVEISESVYRQSEQVARDRGFSVEELIVRALEREIGAETAAPRSTKPMTLPILPSKQPGSLDLSRFNFDDLLS